MTQSQPQPKPVIDGRFQVVKPIGQGAMGAVYIAIDQETEKPVAIKLLKKSDQSLRAKERFLREIRYLETLKHPNVVEIVEHGRDPALDVQYYAMELLFGDPISKLTRLGRSSASLGLMVARQAAEGIMIAHDRGIVHRDLKPANLMLVPREDGEVRVKILDFGLAYEQNDQRLTGVGHAPGTVSYMPPEQLQGEDVDVRGDLYCLGVVLFEMLTGRAPFPGAGTIEIAKSVLSDPPRRLDEILPDFPSALADLIMSLLAKNPEERPPSAEALVDEIASFQRKSELRPISVTHIGPSTDPVGDWGLDERLGVEDVRPKG